MKVLSWRDDVMKKEYAVVSVLKRDENGEVLRLRHKRLGRDVVKIRCRGNGEIYRKLMRVCQKNLPTIYDVYEEDDMVTVLEEFIDGMTVSDVLMSGLYTPKGAVVVCRSICDALYTLHSMDIIHRDVKPENVMIENSGRVVLIDLDASRVFQYGKSKDTKVMGTIGYAAPEQFGYSQTDKRADIFSVGVLMNVMLTGEHPSKRLYSGKLGKVIEKCIAFDPADRYADVTELKASLNKF